MQSSDHRLTSLLAGQAVDMPVLQHQLSEDHSVLLPYWVGDSHWTITSGRLLVDTLPPRAELNRTILPLERMLRGRRSSLVPGEDVATYSLRRSASEHEL